MVFMPFMVKLFFTTFEFFNMTLSAQISYYFAQEQSGGAELAPASEHRQRSYWANLKGK